MRSERSCVLGTDVLAIPADIATYIPEETLKGLVFHSRGMFRCMEGMQAEGRDASLIEVRGSIAWCVQIRS